MSVGNFLENCLLHLWCLHLHLSSVKCNVSSKLREFLLRNNLLHFTMIFLHPTVIFRRQMSLSMASLHGPFLLFMLLLTHPSNILKVYLFFSLPHSNSVFCHLLSVFTAHRPTISDAFLCFVSRMFFSAYINSSYSTMFNNNNNRRYKQIIQLSAKM